MYGSRLALHVAANEEARASDRSSGRTRTAYARGRTVSAYFRNQTSHLRAACINHNGAYFRLAGQLSQLCPLRPNLAYFRILPPYVCYAVAPCGGRPLLCTTVVTPGVNTVLSPNRVCTRDAPPTMSSTLPKHLTSAHTTYAARRRCDSLECSTIISVSSASGAAPSPPAERAATFLSAGSGALDKG